MGEYLLRIITYNFESVAQSRVNELAQPRRLIKDIENKIMLSFATLLMHFLYENFLFCFYHYNPKFLDAS